MTKRGPRSPQPIRVTGRFLDPINGPLRAMQALINEQRRLNALQEHAHDLKVRQDAETAGHTVETTAQEEKKL